MRGPRSGSRPLRLPFTQGREQGIECLTPVPLIGGRNLENVTITGRGVLTTDNAEWLKIMGRTQDHGRRSRVCVRRPIGSACCNCSR